MRSLAWRWPIAAGAFAVHLAFPIGSEQFHLQLAMFPQYIVLFSLGCAAGRRGWLETIDPGSSAGSGLAGALAAVGFPLVLWAGGFFEGDAAEDRFAGGLHWQALAGALLEGVLATCLCLWAVSHFRRHEARYHRPLVRRMAPSAYGAFVVHPPILRRAGIRAGAAPAPGRWSSSRCWSATGVAGSFGLVALGRRVLDHRGEALADADAHRRHAVAAAAAAQLVGERADQAGARAARAGGRARSRRRSRSGGRGRSPSSRIEASTCEANASFSSTRSMSFGSRPARSSALRVAGHRADAH